MTKKKHPAVLPAQDKINATQRKSIGAGEYTGQRPKEEGEALPRTYTTYGQKWTHHSMEPIRPGANDATLIASRGYKC